jgi:hypothetical protein
MIPLEKQVVSLELDKRLKELGMKQESAFYWVKIKELPEPVSAVEVFAEIEGEWYLYLFNNWWCG